MYCSVSFHVVTSSVAIMLPATAAVCDLLSAAWPRLCEYTRPVYRYMRVAEKLAGDLQTLLIYRPTNWPLGYRHSHRSLHALQCTRSALGRPSFDNDLCKNVKFYSCVWCSRLASTWYSNLEKNDPTEIGRFPVAGSFVLSAVCLSVY